MAEELILDAKFVGDISVKFYQFGTIFTPNLS